ncbi:hypothetical protein F5884DRAFT_780204 [Xylogone sp. PMI_703]|nr:hypothetical protein F5884DRAFT_780204 [Xylogone sp. PMI_703]
MQFTTIICGLLAGSASLVSAAAVTKRDNSGSVNLYFGTFQAGEAPDSVESTNCGGCQPIPAGFGSIGFGSISDPSCTITIYDDSSCSTNPDALRAGSVVFSTNVRSFSVDTCC